MFSKTESAKAKGIAILLLLFHHLFYSPARVESSGIQFKIVPQEIVQALAVSARVCVWIFIFVSAYGLTYQYMHRKEENTIQFLTRRWISLMSAYWFVYVMDLILCLLVSKNPADIYKNSILNAAFDFMGWSDFFGTKMITGVRWYMFFAQLLILVIPFVNCVCKKLGWSSYFLLFIIMQYLPEGIKSKQGGKYSSYFLVIVLAVLCARNQIFDRIIKERDSKVKQAAKFVLSLSAVVILLYLREKMSGWDQWQIKSALSSIAAFFICYIAAAFIQNKILSKAFTFLGKHSGNIFLCHSILYLYYPKVLYWSKNAILSYFTLLFLSLMLSVIFELLKKVIHYNKYVQNISNAIKRRLVYEESDF